MRAKYSYNIATVPDSDYYSWVVPSITDIISITNTKINSVGFWKITKPYLLEL